MLRRFATLDVFTDKALSGNPLAVVLDGQGLSPARMQAIAREFNLSETVFVLPPQDPRHRARLRIFTPARELPFAGHPTVGTAVLLALRDGPVSADAVAFGLEETVGVVPCLVEVKDARLGHARFRLPQLPRPSGPGKDPAAVARALGLALRDVGFGRHQPSRHSAGVAYDLVPLRSAVARARPAADFEAVFGDSDHPAVYIYSRETTEAGRHFHARMFAPGFGVSEDPATGSAAAAFAGALMQFEPLGDGEHTLRIEQGYEIGRPSLIDLQLVIRDGALASAEIAGDAVVVAQGEIEA